MNPAVAKITPLLFEMLSDVLEQSGMAVTEVTVSALDSWAQFFKNMPMGLIAFVLFESNIFTKEYRSGTLVLSLTKGLERYKVVIAKSAVLALLWTAAYWMSFVITYVGNTIFWDNSVAQHLGFSAICGWLFGIWIISLILLFSTIANSNTGVLLGTGGVVFASSLFSLLPKINKFFPTFLSDGTALVYGMSEVKPYIFAVIVTSFLTVIAFAVSIPVFNKKQL